MYFYYIKKGLSSVTSIQLLFNPTFTQKNQPKFKKKQTSPKNKKPQNPKPPPEWEIKVTTSTYTVNFNFFNTIAHYTEARVSYSVSCSYSECLFALQKNGKKILLRNKRDSVTLKAQSRSQNMLHWKRHTRIIRSSSWSCTAPKSHTVPESIV